MEAATILTALADLAPAGAERVFDVSGTGRPLVWLPEPDRGPRGARLDRLAALDALHRDERILRRGLAFVVGAADLDGGRRRVRLPLLAQPVRLARSRRGYRVVPAGDLELTALIEDRELAARLEAAPGLAGPGWLAAAGTSAWITAAAEAAGLKLDRVVAKPPRSVDDTVLTGVAAAALFVTRDVLAGRLRDTLLSWAGRPGLAATALARLYTDDAGPTAGPPTGVDQPGGAVPDRGPGGSSWAAGVSAVAAGPVDGRRHEGPGAEEEVLSPLPLNAAQRDVVRRTRAEPVVVVSGAPGNGKSHTLVAAALDTVDRGGSVLVATQSVHAADVLGDLLRRHPGPVPVLFGDAERREAIAADLAGGAAAGADDALLRSDAAGVDAARSRVTAVRAGIVAALDQERLAAALPAWQPLLPALSQDAPGAFDPDADLTAIRTALADATRAGAGWWRRWRQARAAGRLRRLAGVAADVPEDRLRAAVEAATAVRAAARLAATGGTDLTPAWQALTEADDALAAAVGTAMRHRSTSARRWSADARRAASGLGAALRAGRNRRRELLAGLDAGALVRALPLWVGTVADVEDLLPPVAGMFDLVVLDEAAHIDQLRAAPVLARARHALVAGDPRQLRFVSFVADVDVTTTLRRHGLDRFADRLDVRRSSAFDVATGAAPATWLGEHHRSVPHLIGFSARRFYDGRLELVTRHPRNERADVIDVLTVADVAVVDGVNQAEVAAALALVRNLAADPPTGGIAVVSPFRAQADALEAALLAAYDVDEIERLGLRTGTVHAFQGSEADVVIASLGLVDGDPPARHRFVAEPNLFNVLVTRARKRLTVVTSLRSPEGLVGDYLAYAGKPPSPAAEAEPAEGWTAALAEELRRLGLPVRPGYPVGRWRIDLCVGDDADAVGVICAVHPDGVAAHLDRQRTLLRAGWRVYDVFASRWSDDPIRGALDLASRINRP
ncbi:AAA domain-containing protein [Micromonospora inositola]|uniref:Part of AAA domain-containing protein n=1 Tax=Micromonospora inositola TaxID=47865 RepID=A0A1C5JA06_9ACTN|nr:AAA domain-containing protein [Micromonospora inositola]SCG67405.1 Part of AAA domain-containing protein [Micromonospora inositola]